MAANRYQVRGVTQPIYNGTTDVDVMASAGSEYGRLKFSNRRGVRTRLVEAAIRNGDWNIFTGQFDVAIVSQNDIGDFDTDDETDVTKNGEFVYRYGVEVTQKDY